LVFEELFPFRASAVLLRGTETMVSEDTISSPAVGYAPRYLFSTQANADEGVAPGVGGAVLRDTKTMEVEDTISSPGEAGYAPPIISSIMSTPSLGYLCKPSYNFSNGMQQTPGGLMTCTGRRKSSE
jgi:hypothetical protein